VAVNQWVGEAGKISVCKRMKGKRLEERPVRSGRLISRTSVTRLRVRVNNDLSCGNSNEEFERALRDIRHQTSRDFYERFLKESFSGIVTTSLARARSWYSMPYRNLGVWVHRRHMNTIAVSCH